MVRAITGAMIRAAAGKLPLEEFRKKFNKGEKIKIQYVPSNALVLRKINY
jgi:tRNA U38,U39,U40 pseudouridine synthase TruA